jgi:hypothetical protein
MKKIVIAVALIAMVLLFHNSASAAMTRDVGDIVFEDVGIIQGEGGNIPHPFIADVAPFTYRVTLSDLSPAPEFGWKFLGMTLFSEDGVDGFLTAPGEFTYDAVPGQLYWVSIMGEGAGDFRAGLYRVEIKAVPIPGAALLLGSGLFGLVLVRRRKR